jgi:hypothetical protein
MNAVRKKLNNRFIELIDFLCCRVHKWARFKHV